jgi:hypothetical protein
MKKLFLIALVLTGVSTKAQFFQHVYGTSNPDILTSGVNVTAGSPGHIMAGENETPCFSGIYAIPVAYTDLNGNIPGGGPYFQRDYTLLNSSGAYLIPEDAQVYELQNGSGFGVVGKYTDPTLSNPNTGVYYLRLDPAGNPIAVYNYPANAGGGYAYFNVEEVGGITESVSHGILDELFIVGTVQGDNGDYLPFALKVDVNNGSLFWSHIYNIMQDPNPYGDAWGKDIADCLLPHPHVSFVGSVYNTTQSPNSTDGYIQHIDRWSGMPVHPCIFFGTPTSEDHWNSINSTAGPAAPPPPFPHGYILGGGTDVNGSMDYWALRMDPIVGTFWSSTFDYGGTSGNVDDCSDIVERLNTSNNYEYYATGYTDNGTIGGFDMVDVKINTVGAGVGEYTYGSTGDEYGVSLDYFTSAGGGNPDGLSSYGVWDGTPTLGGTDMYHVKSYFSGQSGCNESLAAAYDIPGPGPGLHIPSDIIADFSNDNLIVSFLPLSDLQLCYATSIGGGSNAFVAPAPTDEHATTPNGLGELATRSILIEPNPSEKGEGTVKLKVLSDFTGESDVVIYDMMGREYYTGKFILTKGVNYLPLNILNTEISSGMYKVVLTNGSKNLNTMMLVK